MIYIVENKSRYRAYSTLLLKWEWKRFAHYLEDICSISRLHALNCFSALAYFSEELCSSSSLDFAQYLQGLSLKGINQSTTRKALSISQAFHCTNEELETSTFKIVLWHAASQITKILGRASRRGQFDGI